MTFSDEDYRGLVKIAFGKTVGDVINDINADVMADPFSRRRALDAINRSGLDVKSDASRLMYIVGGGAVGDTIARYLGASRLIGRVAGAVVGNSMYNRSHQDPRRINGYTIRTY